MASHAGGCATPSLPASLLVLLALACGARVQGLVLAHKAASDQDTLNPIRKVTNLLVSMKERVIREGEKEQHLFEKYTCFCKVGKDNLEKTIAELKVKGPQKASELAESKESLARLDVELRSSREDRSAVQRRVERAEKVRNKELEDYQQQADTDRATISALKKAIQSLQGNAASSFLQSEVAALKQFAQVQNLVGEARETFEAVLDGKHLTGTSSGAVGEIIGILNEILKRTVQAAKEAKQKDDERSQEHNALMTASDKESKALDAAVEAKIVRMGKLKVEGVDGEDDVESTEQAIAGDVTLAKDLANQCNTIQTTYTQHVNARADEMVALTKTIDALNKDETLELFNKRSVASFLQVSRKTRKDMRRQEALKLLRTVKSERHRLPAQLDVVLLALRGRGNNFKHIIQSITEMIALLRKEQNDDYKKRETCLKETRDTKSKLQAFAADEVARKKAVQRDEVSLTTVEEEIEVLIQSIKQQDAAMVESKNEREGNHGGYMEVLASNGAALEILQVARDNLLKFYNPTLAGEGGQSGAAQRDYTPLQPNKFGPGAMSMMRGLTSFIQEEVDEQEEDADPDDELDRKEASASVLEMLQKLVLQIERDTKEAEIEEKNHQASYEVLRSDALKERAVLTETVMKKEAVKADLVESLHKHGGKLGKIGKEEHEVEYYLHQLGLECDSLVANFDFKKKARESEQYALQRAADTLSHA